jgi:hypothetical protein
MFDGNWHVFLGLTSRNSLVSLCKARDVDRILKTLSIDSKMSAKAPWAGNKKEHLMPQQVPFRQANNV